MEELAKHPIILWLGALSLTNGFIWFLFSKAEDALNKKTLKSISNWLKNLDPVELVKNWPAQFAVVFDRVFGEKHLSWKCFLRSCIASIISVIIVTLFVVDLKDDLSTKNVLMLFVIAGMLNLIPDYLSLLESRMVIHWMTVKSSLIKTPFFVVVDFILTFLIFISFFGAVIYVLLMVWDLPFSPSELISTSSLLNFDFGAGFGFFLVSTFFTSIWLWIYALSGFTVKLAQKLNISLTWFKGHLDITNKPLRSMAMVSIMIVTIIFVVVPFLR